MIFLFLFFIQTAAAAEVKNFECQEAGKIRFRYAGREVEESSSYCYNPKRSVFISKSCRDSNKCAAHKVDVCEPGNWVLQGKFGTPGFRLCQAVKGSPQLLEFFDGKKWWSMDRCYFEADQSFVDTGILLKKRRDCKKP